MASSHRVTFAYDYGQVYLYDAGRSWSEAAGEYIDALDDATRRGMSVGIADDLVDLLMVRQENFEAPLLVELHESEPHLDDDAWEHIVEFPLPLPSGVLALDASGGGGEQRLTLPAGSFAARWSGRLLAEAAAWNYGDDEADCADEYRLQLWPAVGHVEVRERKRSPVYDG